VVVQLIECLLSKSEALRSNASTEKKERKKEGRKEGKKERGKKEERKEGKKETNC
jgi:hypothetical protein